MYEPDLPFCGRGSPCGNLPLQRRYEELHTEDRRHPVPVFIDFVDLADCRECGMCGACQVHGGCAADWNHLEWLAQFASPGEPACGAVGGPAGRTGHVCALPRHHLGHHRDWRGNGWPEQPGPSTNPRHQETS